jgi:single-strand DNA-binding protein
MNSLTIIGNLTREPDLQTTPNGKNVCKFAVAVNRKYANANGEKEVDYFNVAVWGVPGENAAKYLSKGKKVAVRGSIQFRNYTDKDNNQRTTHDIMAEEVQYLSPVGNAQSGGTGDVTASSKNEMTPVQDDNLPF